MDLENDGHISAAIAGGINETLRMGLFNSIQSRFTERGKAYKLPDEEIVLAAVGENRYMPTEFVAYLTSDTVYVTSMDNPSRYSTCHYLDLYTIEMINILDAFAKQLGTWVDVDDINGVIDEMFTVPSTSHQDVCLL